MLVKRGDEFRIWYGEDLVNNRWEFDNSGQSCANVFAEIEPCKFLAKMIMAISESFFFTSQLDKDLLLSS